MAPNDLEVYSSRILGVPTVALVQNGTHRPHSDPWVLNTNWPLLGQPSSFLVMGWHSGREEMIVESLWIQQRWKEVKSNPEDYSLAVWYQGAIVKCEPCPATWHKTSCPYKIGVTIWREYAMSWVMSLDDVAHSNIFRNKNLCTNKQNLFLLLHCSACACGKLWVPVQLCAVCTLDTAAILSYVGILISHLQRCGRIRSDNCGESILYLAQSPHNVNVHLS